MAINYQNAFKEILNTLKEILYNETKLPIHFDKGYKGRANQYFNITPTSANIISRFSGGTTRGYSVNIRYYLQKGNYEKHTHIDYLTDTGEKIQRLFNEKSKAVSTNDLFQGVLSTFVDSNVQFGAMVAYTFHDGRIEDVTYDPSRDDEEESEDLHIVEFEFEAIVTEVFI